MSEKSVKWFDGRRTHKGRMSASLHSSGLYVHKEYLDKLGEDIKSVDVGFDEKNQMIAIRKGVTFILREPRKRNNTVVPYCVGSVSLSKFIYAKIKNLKKMGAIQFSACDVEVDGNVLYLKINVPPALMEVAA